MYVSIYIHVRVGVYVCVFPPSPSGTTPRRRSGEKKAFLVGEIYGADFYTCTNNTLTYLFISTPTKIKINLSQRGRRGPQAGAAGGVGHVRGGVRHRKQELHRYV